MNIQRGYKYELRVNNQERTLLAKAAGIARFAWNWGLAERLRMYRENEGNDRYTDAMKQHKQLNRLKQSDYPWMYEVSKCVPQEALRDLEQAFQNFYQDIAKARQTGRKRTVGFPKFKKKNKSKASFRLTGTIRIETNEKRVQLPRLGKLRLKERPHLAPTARILSATVSRMANRWYVALTVEESIEPPSPQHTKVIGLDAGLEKFITLSSGFPVPRPKFLLRRLKKLRRLSKAHSRKQQGSNNRKKSAQRLARFHRKVANTRRDFLHKQSTYLVKNHDVVVKEDLHVKGLIRNKKLSRHWADLAHGEFQRMLEYKGAKYGTLIVDADRWFPSSKLCSNCLMYNATLTLQDRIFRCPYCGLEIDRDFNASVNLEQYYYMFVYPQLVPVATSSEETLNAGGETVRPAPPQARLNEAGNVAPKSDVGNLSIDDRFG